MMRLLDINELTFTSFEGPNIPRYAIASHRWCEDEPAYKDVLKRRRMGSEGFQKILLFCRAVKKLDPSMRWLWIDTCCIDKTSSAELSESINLMFRWYRKAAFCVAYLGDVSSPGQEDLPAHSHHIHDDRSRQEEFSGFQRSEWFARGWTLQELVAPKTVVFLSKEAEIIGRKGCLPKHVRRGMSPNLEKEISAVTKIPQVVLSDYKQSHHLTLPQKLAWITGRQTTRVEDMAYCLLGILDVSIPAIYGESFKASLRLQRAIEEQSRDQDTSASTAPTWHPSQLDLQELSWGDFVQMLQSLDDTSSVASSTRSNALFLINMARNGQYYGREQEIRHLKICLESSTLPGVPHSCSVYGMAGIGKTETVLEYAYRFQDDYDAVYWVRANCAENLKVDFEQIGRELDLEFQDMDMTSKVEYVRRTLGDIDQR